MEKLIGLLNEFCREKRGDYVVVRYREKEHSFDTFVEGKVDYMTDLYVVSKRCEFIKWLVDNNKIDLYKFPQVMEYSDYESLLMYLSISDEPLDLLIPSIK